MIPPIVASATWCTDPEIIQISILLDTPSRSLSTAYPKARLRNTVAGKVPTILKRWAVREHIHLGTPDTIQHLRRGVRADVKPRP